MVGLARAFNQNLIDYFPENIRKIGFRQIIILSMGPLSSSITFKQSYTLASNLNQRIPSTFRINLPTYDIFQKMVAKLQRSNVIESIRLDDINQYQIKLTEYGLGEYDYIKHIIYPKYDQIWLEYLKFVNIIF